MMIEQATSHRRFIGFNWDPRRGWGVYPIEAISFGPAAAAERARAFLESIAKRRNLITYQELANALQILPPYSIHRVTEVLERLMEEDAADRSFVAAACQSRSLFSRRPDSSTSS
jgi:hypothetical protein